MKVLEKKYNSKVSEKGIDSSSFTKNTQQIEREKS